MTKILKSPLKQEILECKASDCALSAATSCMMCILRRPENDRCRSVPQRYFCTFGCIATPSAHLRLVALHRHSSCTCKSCLAFLFHYIRLLTSDLDDLLDYLPLSILLTCCLLNTISTAAAPQLSVMRMGLLCSNQTRRPRDRENLCTSKPNVRTTLCKS